MISFLVDASVTSIDDAITPAANWILELLDNKNDIQQTTGETINTSKLLRFLETVATPFVNIQSKHFKKVRSTKYCVSIVNI